MVTLSAQAFATAVDFGDSETHPRREHASSTPLRRLRSTSHPRGPPRTTLLGEFDLYRCSSFCGMRRSRDTDGCRLVSPPLSPVCRPLSHLLVPTCRLGSPDSPPRTSADALLLSLSHRLRWIHHSEARPDHPRAARDAVQSLRSSALVVVVCARLTACAVRMV